MSSLPSESTIQFSAAPGRRFAPSGAVVEVAEIVEARVRSAAGPITVGIDGVDGVGKTVFADLLRDELRNGGVIVHRASIDDFHYPRAHRYRRGRSNPVGYLEDSFDHEAFVRLVLAPLQPGADRRIRLRHHDLVSDAYLDEPPTLVGELDVVVVDGVFLQSSLLCPFWTLTVFLDAPFEWTVARAIERDHAEARHERPAAEQLARERYVPGQQLYLERHQPLEHADVVVDATDPATSRVVRR